MTHSNYKLIVSDKPACFTHKSTNSDPRCVLVIPGPLATLKLLCTSDLLHVITPKKQIKRYHTSPKPRALYGKILYICSVNTACSQLHNYCDLLPALRASRGIRMV